jgi:amino acid transporter
MALRRDLSLLETAALSIAIMAPTAAMALNGSLAASLAGPAAPLAFLGALLTVVFVAYAFTTFSRRYATSGSVYAFASRGLGVRAGFLSGWSLLFTYMVFTIASASEVGLFFQTFVGLLGASVPWILPTLAALALILGLGLRRLEIGTRVTLAVEGISVLLILITVVVIFVHFGHHSLSSRPFVPRGVSASDVGLASVFGFLSFAGFEGAAVLGEEARNPKRAIPRAIWLAVIGCGVFYLIVIYAQSLGFGLTAAGAGAFGKSSDPMVFLTSKYAGHAMSIALAAGATVSAYAAAFGSTVGASRLLFTFGRDGLLSPRLGKTNAAGTPALAIGVSAVVPAIACLAWYANGTGAGAMFGDFGTIGVLALLLAYLATQFAAIRLFVRNEWRGIKLVVPVVAIGLIGYAFYANVYPVPAAPIRYFPYMVVAWLAVGVAVSYTRPAAMKQIAADLADEAGTRAEAEPKLAAAASSLQQPENAES